LKEIVCGEGVHPGRVQVFPNGVSDRFFTDSPAGKPAKLEGKSVLLFFGSLKPWHGLSFLLDAFKSLVTRRPVGLWIVGDGPLRKEIEGMQRDYPEQIHWEGAVEHERLPGILKAADLALVPYPSSAPDYFCPLKVIEALAAGCPVVASDSPMVRAWVGDPPQAALFEADSLDDFIRAMEGLLDDPDRREALRRGGQKIARDRHTWRQRAEELRELFGWSRSPSSPSSEVYRG
jgi:glycosyltransferase involved in cell wall biosynthesis